MNWYPGAIAISIVKMADCLLPLVSNEMLDDCKIENENLYEEEDIMIFGAVSCFKRGD